MEPNKRSWGTEVRNFRWDLSLLILGFLLGVSVVTVLPTFIFHRNVLIVLVLAAIAELIRWHVTRPCNPKSKGGTLLSSGK
jgi:hypothetical protein